MSNLGAYQVMTTVANRVGGPIKLGGLLLTGGFILGQLTQKAIDKYRYNRQLLQNADSEEEQ